MLQAKANSRCSDVVVGTPFDEAAMDGQCLARGVQRRGTLRIGVQHTQVVQCSRQVARDLHVVGVFCRQSSLQFGGFVVGGPCRLRIAELIEEEPQVVLREGEFGGELPAIGLFGHQAGLGEDRLLKQFAGFLQSGRFA